MERDLGRLPDRPSSLLTLEQFKRLVRDGMKADLINGLWDHPKVANCLRELGVL